MPGGRLLISCLSLCPPNDGVGSPACLCAHRTTGSAGSVASAETAIDTPMSPAGSVHQSRRGSQRGEQDPSLLRCTGAELDHSVGRTPAGDVVGAIHEGLALAAGRVALRQPSELVEEPAALLRRRATSVALTLARGEPRPDFGHRPTGTASSWPTGTAPIQRTRGRRTPDSTVETGRGPTPGRWRTRWP